MSKSEIKKKLKRLVRIIFLGDPNSKNYFVHQKEKIANQNCQTLKISSVIGFILNATMLISCIYTKLYIKALPALIISAVLITFIVFYSFCFLNNHTRIVNYLFCALLIVAYSLSMYFDLVLFPTSLSPLFCVFICVLPPLFFSYPFLSYTLNLIFCGAYIIIVHFLNIEGSLIERTTFLVIFCFLISCASSFLSNYQRISTLREQYETSKQRDTDDLTGIPNRRSFNVRFDEYTHGENKSLSGAIMMDIDDFKIYNDLYGHLKGDEVLAKIGQVLQSVSEKYGVFIARYGGEEFVAIITYMNLNNIDKISLAIENGIRALQIPFESKQREQKIVTISIGVAYAGYEETAMDILNKADNALYKAKNAGKNRIIVI